MPGLASRDFPGGSMSSATKNKIAAVDVPADAACAGQLVKCSASEAAAADVSKERHEQAVSY